MFWGLRIGPGEDERNVYAEANEYGIICRPQDLQGIIERLDKYIKKTKVRGAGLTKYIGRRHLLFYNAEQWYEWGVGLSCSKEGRLSNEQGRLWYFELLPNRHYYFEQNSAEEIYEFPERKENGEIVCADSDAARKKRETFFEGLLDCIGFPLEILYTYPEDSATLFDKREEKR